MRVVNVADALRRMAQQGPEAIALRLPGRGRPEDWTYRRLDEASDALARGFNDAGIGAGTRTALMVRPGAPLFLSMFALFKAGAVPVLIDPGIQRRALRDCLDQAEPEAFIGIPLAHAARIALGWARRSVRIVVTVGSFRPWGGHTLNGLLARGKRSAAALPVAADDDLAAILFTSGSTGLPKGVEYRHRHFAAQVRMIQEAFSIQAGEIDLPTFPPFALFDPGLGMRSVIPDMDPTRPARADPEKLIRTLREQECTSMFGSPALLDNLSRYAQARSVRLTALRRVLSAGAPVRPDTVARTYPMLPEDARLWTPYGATECLPVSVIEGREVLSLAARTNEGAGICVGHPLPANRVRIIRITDQPIAEWSDGLLQVPGEVGEITVIGPTTTQAYFRNPAANALAKIREGQHWVHRMGDVGYWDAEGRLWYCGRKSHRVITPRGTLYTEQIEGVFNTHPGVQRSALVGLGQAPGMQAVVCIEPAHRCGSVAWARLCHELWALARAHATTQEVAGFAVYAPFPVDIRHNAKIQREALARWVQRNRHKVFWGGDAAAREVAR